MENRHPKRRKDKYNPYTLIKNDDGFFLSFKDGQAITHMLELSIELYNLMDSFELDDVSYFNEWDRHIEQSELTESTLERRMLKIPLPIDETIYQKEEYEALHKAIDQLSEIQRNRLILYFFYKLTYKQIAEIEGCTIMPIKRSVDRALKKIKNFFENRG